MASLSGVSSSNTVSSLMNSANMISGLASGLDTESMIENLVKSYQTKINTLNQKITKTEWKQDAYRSIISKMVGFSSKYTSYTSGTNLTSPSFFSSAVKVATQGVFADRVSASGKTSSDVSLDRVTQLATSAQYRTAGNLKSGDGQSIAAEAGFDLLNGTTELGKLGGSLTLTYGSNKVSVSFDQVADVEALQEIREKNQGIGEDEALAKLIEQKLADQQITFSGGKTETADKRIKVEVKDGTLTFRDKSTAGNSVYISQASGNVADMLGLDLENASEDKINSFKLSQGLRDNLTFEENNAEFLSEKAMNLSLDGVTKQITMPKITGSKAKGYKIEDADGNQLDFNTENYTKVLNDAVQKAFKGSKIKVENLDETGKSLQLSFRVQEGSDLIINTGVGETLGIGRVATSYLNTNKTLGDLMELKDSDALKDKNGEFILDDKGNKQYALKINDTLIGKYTQDSKLSDILSDINSNTDAGVKVSYSQTTKNFLFTSKETGLESEIELGKGLAQSMFGSGIDTQALESKGIRDVVGAGVKGEKISLKIDDKTYEYGPFTGDNPTMQQTLSAINGALKKDGLTASYGKDGSLVITDKDGKQVQAESGNDFTENFLSSLEDYAAQRPNEVGYTKGQDAKFTVTVNGEQKEMTRSTNSVNIDGLTITMKDTFDGYKDEDGEKDAVTSAGRPKNSVTFQSTTDSDKIVDAVKGMIEDYNAMMSEIKSAYSTMPYQKSNGTFANYEPLTDEDREGMSESAIERYEEKAKQGILFGDRNLSNLYDKLRNVFSPAGADGATLRAMGISTSFSISDGSQAVTLDEGKLREMLESDPDRVADVFTKSDGVMQNMKTQLDLYSKTTGEPKGILIQQSGSPLSSLSLMNNSWQKEIDSYTTQIEKWQDKLENQVERYTSQFSRLEVLINQMNSQSSTLAGLMGG